mmetsp:Transcript_5419/g.6237  ORF Transcript_5419/g.6237 Transcript_5419/m.6237 type:complete len:908 (-) Transcript_5419:199-2922(-)|eukprot:CAMPEP_0197848038 /NCGR_PEP_ID=MMETSP1438-20131217/7864_1 /TAXON_ID=1461541 /ORGANISM="Pterosperma sp., Strain CCMP1384" /LENGTH=907 /DNA_ID=CAMNT_0043460161 /DNA_START=225 /DNA_END=2948 /DNA_ORIENTATION=+
MVREQDTEEYKQFLTHVRPNRWIEVDVGEYRLFRFNWVTSLIASVMLWGFGIACLVDGDATYNEFKQWQTWITQNFTWLYIGTQDVWTVFLLYIMMSQYGTLKLGKKDEKPQYSDFTWFAMLFSCGIAVGIYYWGVSEPMYYYRAGYGNALVKPGFQNDDQRAQQAMFITFFHWGLHAWVVYIVAAVLLGFVTYRWNLPMTIRMAFYPLVGDLVYGLLGDLIDAISMACTTFGVCTSLGFGVASINAGFHRLNSNIPADDQDWQVGLILVITCVATISVITGINNGIRRLSEICFAMGCFILIMFLFMDNTWFLLNSFVQSTGHYFQWVIQVGHECDTWQQLNLEFQNGMSGAADYQYATNQLWGSGSEKLYDRISDAMVNTAGHGTPRDWIADNHWHNMQMTSAQELINFMAPDAPPGPSPPPPIPYDNEPPPSPDSPPPSPPDSPSPPSSPPPLFMDSTSMYDSHPTAWIDWWTIFYWGWWISWAPFVGTFIAKISRGRTIRQVIVGAMIAPIMYSFLALGILGSLGIKMERVAELVLSSGAPDPHAVVDYENGSVDCAGLGYSGGEPVRDDAIALAKVGYYPLACRAHTGRIFDVTEPYGDHMSTFLQLAIIVNLILYFITSSDSGSWVDDSLSANGLANPPVIQKVYWAFTEGMLAIALLVSGGSNALSAMQAASICAGFPYTIAICFMCTALWRACKIDFKEEDIMTGRKFNTGLLDGFEGFVRINQKKGAPTASERIASIAKGMLVPFMALQKVLDNLYGKKGSNGVWAAIYSIPFYTWIICMCLPQDNVFAIAWACFMLFAFVLVALRNGMREKHHVYGSTIEDICCAIFVFPLVVSQLEFQATHEIEMDSQVPDHLRTTVDESDRKVVGNGAEPTATKAAVDGLPLTGVSEIVMTSVSA